MTACLLDVMAMHLCIIFQFLNLSLSIRLVLFRAVANPLLVRVKHRGKGTALTNATATQGSSGREQVLRPRWFRTYYILLNLFISFGSFSLFIKASSGLSTVKLHLVNRKIISFHANRLPLTLAAIDAIEVNMNGSTPAFPS